MTSDQGLDAARIHGRLQEALHGAGYTFERAMGSLEWLIADDRWKLAGFQTPADFIASLDFSKLRVSVEQRKEFVRFVSATGATQRQIAGALGISPMTVSRDVTNVTSPGTVAKESNGSDASLVTNVTVPWTDIDADPSKLAKRQQQQSEKRAAAMERAANLSKRNADLPAGQRKYGVILADPPWRYDTILLGDIARSVANHYPTMTPAEIEALPVSNLAAKDCALFLWCVIPQLPEALGVIKAWGFEYKTAAFVWVKQKDAQDPFIGLGMWTRSNDEMCLLATRGSPTRLNADVRQVIIEPRREHSRKPDTAAERIERLVAGPYIELFSRQPRKGWDAWGNQA